MGVNRTRTHFLVVQPRDPKDIAQAQSQHIAVSVVFFTPDIWENLLILSTQQQQQQQQNIEKENYYRQARARALENAPVTRAQLLERAPKVRERLSRQAARNVSYKDEYEMDMESSEDEKLSANKRAKPDEAYDD